MSDQTSISVSFGRPTPLFPLDGVTLLPQQILPLHIYEPRYRQMIDDVLDASGQVAMGIRSTRDHGLEAGLVRPFVCLGQIVQHERLPDGRFNILMHGICRARILEQLPPDERPYRRVVLEPVGTETTDEGELGAIRSSLERRLDEGPLTQMRACEQVLEYLHNDEVPTSAMLELVSFTMLADPELRYRLLAEGDIHQRVELIDRELDHLTQLLRRAQAQRPEDWPKGCSWN